MRKVENAINVNDNTIYNVKALAPEGQMRRQTKDMLIHQAG